jgi:hypothetical protein
MNGRVNRTNSKPISAKNQAANPIFQLWVEDIWAIVKNRIKIF